jgi:hypothetical protein
MLGTVKVEMEKESTPQSPPNPYPLVTDAYVGTNVYVHVHVHYLPSSPLIVTSSFANTQSAQPPSVGGPQTQQRQVLHAGEQSDMLDSGSRRAPLYL